MTRKFHKVAILGATGPTGRALEAELRRRGQAVRVVSRSTARLETAFPAPDIERRAGDALDLDSVLAAVDGCDCVVDCIGLPAAQMADHPRTAHSIAAAIQRTGARCLQVSSYWCYIPIGALPVTEELPRSGGPPWARLRREAEDILRGAGAAIVHLPDFFGPAAHTGTLQMALRDAAAGRAINWIGGIDVERDYIYVPDAMRVVADLLPRREAYGEDWIVPGSGPLSARRLADVLSPLLGRKVVVRAAGPAMLRLVSLFSRDLRGFMQLVPTYVRPIRFDGTRLERLLGTPERTTYEDAVAETLRALAA